MTPNTKPTMIVTPKVWRGRVTTANTNRDGTGALETIATGGVYGSRIHKIAVRAQYNVDANIVRLYIDDGAVIRLWAEVPTAFVHLAGSEKRFEYVMNLLDCPLEFPAGVMLRASTHLLNSNDITCEGGDY